MVTGTYHVLKSSLNIWQNRDCSLFSKFNETHISCSGANKRFIEISSYLSKQFNNCTLFFNNSGVYSCPKMIGNITVGKEWAEYFSPYKVSKAVSAASSSTNLYIKIFVCSFVVTLVTASIFLAYKARNKKIESPLVEKPVPSETPVKETINNKIEKSIRTIAKELEIPLVTNVAMTISDLSEEKYEKLMEFLKTTPQRLDNTSQPLQLATENTFVGNSLPLVKKITVTIQYPKSESLEKEAMSNKFIEALSVIVKELEASLTTKDVIAISNISKEKTEKFMQLFQAAVNDSLIQ